MSDNTERKIFPFYHIRANDVSEGIEIERLLFEAGYFWYDRGLPRLESTIPRATLITYPCVFTLGSDGSLSWGKKLLDTEVSWKVASVQQLREAACRADVLTTGDFKRAAAALNLADRKFFRPVHVLRDEQRYSEGEDGALHIVADPLERAMVDDDIIRPGKIGLAILPPAPIPPCGGRTLPTDSGERKGYPIYTGCVKYFPAALAGVAKHSKKGNDQHNPGQPMHHSRGKSNDHLDCVHRHSMDIADLEARIEREGPNLPAHVIDQILEEANALSWRALAYSQGLHERLAGAPLAPGAKI